jgi:hypothetical protein
MEKKNLHFISLPVGLRHDSSETLSASSSNLLTKGNKKKEKWNQTLESDVKGIEEQSEKC